MTPLRAFLTHGHARAASRSAFPAPGGARAAALSVLGNLDTPSSYGTRAEERIRMGRQILRLPQYGTWRDVWSDLGKNTRSDSDGFSGMEAA